MRSLSFRGSRCQAAGLSVTGDVAVLDLLGQFVQDCVGLVPEVLGDLVGLDYEV